MSGCEAFAALPLCRKTSSLILSAGSLKFVSDDPTIIVGTMVVATKRVATIFVAECLNDGGKPKKHRINTDFEVNI